MKIKVNQKTSLKKIVKKIGERAGSALTKTEFAKYSQMTIPQLKKLGFLQWEEQKNGKALMLIPGELYKKIPEKTQLTDINGKEIVFKKGKTDNDVRFGVLAYGIIANKIKSR